MRLALAALGFVSIVVFPLWVTCACAGILALRWRAWEAIVMGACLDLVWQPYGPLLHTLPWFTIAALVVVWGFEPLRTQFFVAQ